MSFWKGRKVLITGHTGFKGSWLALWLDSLGASVCGYSLEPESSPNLFQDLRLAELIDSNIGDIRELDNFQDVLDRFRPEIVFHLAAQSLVRRSYRSPIETYSTNVLGTVNVLDAIRHSESVKAAIVVTTDKVYQNKEKTTGYSEGERLGGFDPYSNSKACAELVVSSYRDSFFGDRDCLIASARAGNVIGGGDWSEDRLLPDVFRALIFEKELLIRNPDSVRPWQHTLEPLAGYLLLGEKLLQGERRCATAWNFGPRTEDSKEVSFILERIKQMWDEDVQWQIADGDHPHETNILRLDSTKAADELGWRPKLDLESALTLTTDWYRDFRNKADLRDVTRKQIEFYESL
ncbi:MAG: CDP-glucose 4,6-dehydratase [Pyrinomonadaceae bacterium]